jgi:predicted dinucleotide-binding enzyme
MKVGILGSGTVAKALAGGFLKHGHQVMVGARTPAKLADWKTKNPEGCVGSLAEAAMFADLGVLAVKGLGALETIRLADPANLAGKTVIDVTNPLAEAPAENGVLRYFTTLDESLMEQLQREFQEIRFVKAFNSTGNALFVNPQFKDGPPTMFICGNDEAAKQTVSEILGEFGWEVTDMGKVEAARAIEPLCMLWCIPGLLRNEWGHAFKFLG